MKSIISTITLGLGLISSPALAQEDTRKLSSEIFLGTPDMASAHTRRLTHGVLENVDSKMQNEWKSNIQSIATRILPGDPVSLRTNTTRGIMYQILGDKKGDIKGYIGVYKDLGTGTSQTGLLITIPLSR